MGEGGGVSAAGSDSIKGSKCFVGGDCGNCTAPDGADGALGIDDADVAEGKISDGSRVVGDIQSVVRKKSTETLAKNEKTGKLH